MLPRNKKCAVTSNDCMTSWRTPSDVQVKMNAASLQLARIYVQTARASRAEIINSLRSALRSPRGITTFINLNIYLAGFMKTGLANIS